jgi:hypothetical protein
MKFQAWNEATSRYKNPYESFFKGDVYQQNSTPSLGLLHQLQRESVDDNPEQNF